jgi:general secretion pathway protein H
MLNPKSKIQNPKSGFTLLELIVVIFIISLSLMLIMPAFWISDESILKTEARHFSSTLRYIHDEAIGKKQPYLLLVNLDRNTWGFNSEKETRNFIVKKDIRIKDIVIPSHGEISQGEITVVFGPLGPEEPIVLHLQKGEAEYTIIFNHINGRTKIHKGYLL